MKMHASDLEALRDTVGSLAAACQLQVESDVFTVGWEIGITLLSASSVCSLVAQRASDDSQASSA